MKVKEIMNGNKVQFCTPETRLRKAAKVMRNANCGALPVVNGKNKVVGIVTDRDICLSLAEKKKSPSRIRVSDVMTRKAVTVRPNDEMAVALREMRTKKIGRLPVVDKSGKLKGIISLHNLLATDSGDRKTLNGSVAGGESILKTVKALTSRYEGDKKKNKKTARAVTEQEN